MPKTIRPSDKPSKKASKSSRKKQGYAYGGSGLGCYGDETHPHWLGSESRKQAIGRRHADKMNAKARKFKLARQRAKETPDQAAKRAAKTTQAACKMFRKWIEQPHVQEAVKDRSVFNQLWQWDLNNFLDELVPDRYLPPKE